MLGATSKRWAQSELTKTISDAQFWHLLSVEKLGDDVCLKYTQKSARK
jgi:hypothetical protein